MRSHPSCSGIGFTAIFCQTCNTNPELPVLPTLRETIRRCPHDVLVSSGCPLGHVWCHTRNRNPGTAGAVLVVQPCTTSTRQPVGPAIPVGPLRTTEDGTALARWRTQSRPPARNYLPLLQRLPRHEDTAADN